MDASNPTHIHALCYQPAAAPHDTLTDSELRQLYRVDLTLSHESPVGSDLGVLEMLPVEIFWQILEHLSVPCLMRFRHINRYARFFVDSLPSFQAIIKEAPQAIRSVLAIQTSCHISLPYLYSKLQRRVCDSCGSLAQHLWLPTVSRLCFSCIRSRPRPMQLDELLHHCGLEPHDLIDIPSFRFIPGIFTNHRYRTFREVRGRHILFDTLYAEKIVFQRTGRLVRRPGTLMTEGKPIPVLSRRCHSSGITIVELKNPHYLPRWKMATVIAPWISGKDVEMGVMCVACFNTKEHQRLYTRQGFLEHLTHCRVQPFDDCVMFLRFALHNHTFEVVSACH